jgi:hypothetical protein
MNHLMTIKDTRGPTIVGAQRKHLATMIERPWLSVALLRAVRLVLGLLRSGMLVVGAALLMGCTTLDESAPDCLPEPTPRRVDSPAYTPEQQAKKEEVDQFLCDRYQAEGWQILETTQTYGGDIIDWLDPASVPGSQEEPPPKPTPEELQLPEGVELQVTELDMYPELRGSAGIPMTRPSFAAYILGDTGASSVEDFLTNHVVGGQPAGQDRLYGGYRSTVDNTGIAGRLNQFVGDVEEGTFSLLELAVACEGSDKATTLEQIGVVASRDKANFGDAVVRLQVEFFSEGIKLEDEIGGWDGLFTGFVAVDGRPYGPGLALVPLSTVNGAQYDSHFKIQLRNGNWWVAHNGNWLGYYPGKFFDLIGSKACFVAWYGEVYDGSPADWTWTDMGSGMFASAGLDQASYVRGLLYYDGSGISNPPTSVAPIGPVDSKCYTTSEVLLDAKGDPYFFVSGPGGDAMGCD